VYLDFIRLFAMDKNKMPLTINSEKDDTPVIHPLDQGKKISTGLTGETISMADAVDASDLLMFL